MNGENVRYLTALRTRIPVWRGRHLRPWWLIAGGYSLGMAWLLAFDSRWGWVAFHLTGMAWMLWPIRDDAP